MHCLLTGSTFVFFTIWRGQPDANPVLIDLKPQAAVFVVLDQLAEVGIGGGIGGQALFELGVVGIDFGSAVVFVEIQFGDFSLLFGDLFHLTFLSSVHFLGSRAGKSGLKFDSEAVSDVLVVHGFSIGYKDLLTKVNR